MNKKATELLSSLSKEKILKLDDDTIEQMSFNEVIKEVDKFRNYITEAQGLIKGIKEKL